MMQVASCHKSPLDVRLGEILLALQAPIALQPLGEALFVTTQKRANDWVFDRQLVAELSALMLADARFGDRGHLMVATANGARAFYPPTRTLLEKLYQTGDVNAAIAWLTKVLATTSAIGYVVSVLYGVDVAQPFEIVPGLTIMPLDCAPPTKQLQRFLETTDEMLWFLRCSPPQAALVSTMSVSPFVYRGDSGEARPPERAVVTQEYFRLTSAHSDMARLLTLIGPCLPLIVESWFSFHDPDLHLASGADSSRSWPNIEIASVFGSPVQLIGHEEAKQLATAFQSFPAADKLVVDLALDRLRHAQARLHDGDRAVEIFVALEALLGDGQSNELSHKMSTRAVRLLGGSSADRLRTFQLLKKFYEVRSKVMHTGKVDPARKYTVANVSISLSQLADESTAVCAAVIRRIIELGCIPKWGEFDIN